MLGLRARTTLLIAGILVSSSLPAHAVNLLSTSFSGAQTFTEPGLAKVFSSGSFTQGFNTPQTETVMISFSAVCSTSGIANENTSVQILIDGSGIYPSGVLCSAVGPTSNTTGTAAHGFVTSRRVGAGNHTIQVRVTPRYGGESRISNLNLLVWD